MRTTSDIVSKEEFDEIVNQTMGLTENEELNKQAELIKETIAEKLSNWLENHFVSEMNGVEDISGMADMISWILVILTGIVLLVLAICIGRIIYRKYKAKGKLKEILGEQITKETTPMSLRDKAKSYKMQNALRLSVRYAYIALLYQMHEKNLLYLEDTMTNKEIYQYLERNQYPRLSVFKEVMECFNYTWYGEYECTEDEYLVFESNIEKLWNEVISNGKG